MTIEKSLERIADALEFANKYQASESAITPQPKKPAPPLRAITDDDIEAGKYKEPDQAPAPDLPSEDELIVALEQFIPARKEEAMLIMNKFGVAKKSDVPPGMRAGLIQELNAVYNS